MEKEEKIVNAVLAVAGTCFHFLFGGWSKALTALVLMMVVDYVLGIRAAHKAGEYDSKVGKEKLFHKLFFVSSIVVGRLIDIVLGLNDPIFQTLVIYGLMGHEVHSWIENAAKAGYWVPEGIKKGLAQLREKSGDKK